MICCVLGVKKNNKDDYGLYGSTHSQKMDGISGNWWEGVELQNSNSIRVYHTFIQAMSASSISLDSNLMLKQATGLKWLLIGFVMTTMISLITSE